MASTLSQPFKCIIFLSYVVIHRLRTMNVLRLEGGMYMRPLGTKISIFSHILLGLCTPLRSSHG